MKNKKGTIWPAVSIMLLVIAIIIFYFPFTLEASDLISKSGDSSACALSLAAGTDTSKCPFYDVVIFNDKVELNGKKAIERKNQPVKSFANDAIAKLMVKCLSNGGGYNSRAFSPDSYVFEESICLRCFTVKIDQSVGNVNGLTQYMRDSKPKNSPSGKTYLESLTKDDGHLRAYMEYGAGLGLAPSSGNFVFKPGETPGDDYTVFFMGVKEGYLTRKIGWAALFDPYTAEFLEDYFKIHDSYFVYAAESKNLPKACDRQIN